MTQLLDERVPRRHFVLQVEVDPNGGSVWNDPDNDVKRSEDNPRDELPEVQQLLDEGVPRRHFVLQVEVYANGGSVWNDPNSDVKRSKDNPQDEVPEV